MRSADTSAEHETEGEVRRRRRYFHPVVSPPRTRPLNGQDSPRASEFTIYATLAPAC
jgi:hypothetical protein